MAVKKPQAETTQTKASQKPTSADVKSEGNFLKVKLVRSLVGRPRKQREVVKGLGLRKMSSEVIRKDCPEIWGMINKVSHLVQVEAVEKK
ncbi:MAG: 50S ribosomal protein L30 [Candidatus Aminicenantes bacterium]|nr:MAG: 50S ribosomal protein L30 [Candidatus Aminicenantes bacterium]